MKINARKRKPLKLQMRMIIMRVVFDDDDAGDVLFNVDVGRKFVGDSKEISSVDVVRSIFDLIRTRNAEVIDELDIVVVVVVVVVVRF